MVNIEIDGIPLKVDASKMIIQAADEAGIDIPRFCYHKKLSIAANCRMCLVEVAGSRKALPACATPVTEGMQVFTQSGRARAAQRGVMEFLLINHPLDCPICDQGGECELQDMSVGYGEGVGRYSEAKRVVRNKSIGPLIQTDMTRCIHCTRCVRFGQEIAGIKELGATGRGEHMEIDTYITKSLHSELSGNIIDLCPVGALTSKPFRYQARAWELTAHPAIALHDAVGSNIEIHTRRQQVMRVVPRENESLNETWLSDRDRFSYLGLNHAQRALHPMIKVQGAWQKTDWETALQATIDGLKVVKTKYGADQMAALVSPMATLEEHYLLQKLMRGLGSPHIQHRLRQLDFSWRAKAGSGQAWDLQTIADYDEILLVGSHLRIEQPIISHRIRQAAKAGTGVMSLNFFEAEMWIPGMDQITGDTTQLLNTLAAIAKILLANQGEIDEAWQSLFSTVTPTAQHQTLAMRLSNANRAVIIMGALASQHPHAAKFKALCDLISQATRIEWVTLPEANSTAAELAEMAASQPEDSEPFSTNALWEQKLRAYVLMGFEIGQDCAQPQRAATALQQASFVVAMTSYMTDAIEQYADVILPVASFTETSGTFVGIDGQWQSFTGAVQPKGESRPGWKVLRVLGNLAHLPLFDYVSSTDIRDEIRDQLKLKPSGTKRNDRYVPETLQGNEGLMWVTEVPMYRCDPIVRRSEALQQTDEMDGLVCARMNQHEAKKWGVSECKRITIKTEEGQSEVALQIDEAIADNCLYLPATTDEAIALGQAFSMVTVQAVTERGA